MKDNVLLDLSVFKVHHDLYDLGFLPSRLHGCFQWNTSFFFFGFVLLYSCFSSVMRSKLKIVTVQKINSRIWDVIDNCNINSLAKNQVSANFHSRAIRRSVLPNLQSFVWRRHVGAHPDGHQDDSRKPTETSGTEFCYISTNLSLEELKNIKIILFLIQEPVQTAKFTEISPEISHFLTNSAVM